VKLKSLAPLFYVLPLLVVLVAVLIYPLADMAYQGALPQQEEGLGAAVAGGEAAATKAGWRSITYRNYVAVFTDPFLRSTLQLSLTLAVLVSLLSIVLCMGPAWLLVRKQFRGKRAFRVILTLPMAFSGIIIGFLAVIMIGRIGFVPEVTRWLFGVPVGQGLAYGVIGLSLAYIWFQIPRATLTLESAIRKFDWDLESAARGLGASPWQAFRYVLLPLLMPAIVSTIAVTFAVSMGSFGVALLLLKKASVLPLEIYNQVYANLAFEMAAAMSVVLAVITVGVNYTLRRYGERNYVYAHAD